MLTSKIILDNISTQSSQIVSTNIKRYQWNMVFILQALTQLNDLSLLIVMVFPSSFLLEIVLKLLKHLQFIVSDVLGIVHCAR